MMKLDSKYFDSIRIKPDREGRKKPEQAAKCDWLGCTEKGGHLAPKGRGRDGEYYSFCLEHVREYNKSYNYFAGMTNDEIADFQKEAVIGHRPTWRVAENAWRNQRIIEEAQKLGGFARRFAHNPGLHGFGEQETAPRRRKVHNAELKCLRALNLDAGASAADIKAQFKTLVKMCHPDSNGGDRGSEDRLREVIQAYNHLKRAGLC
jgi:hypothetical protein